MVTGAYYPEISSGGLQTRLMARAFAGRAEVKVLTTALDLTTPRYARVDDVEITRIHLRTIRAASKMTALAMVLPDVIRLVRWCDVIHLHGVSAKNILVTAVARMFGKPIVLSLHTTGADEPAPIKRAGMLSWSAFRSAARYMSVSEGLMKSYLDADLVFVGAIKSDYYEVDDSLAGTMRREAESLGIADRLTFTGSLHDVHEYFQLADVFVLPSRREGLPVALMEAMSCALPCVA